MHCAWEKVKSGKFLNKRSPFGEIRVGGCEKAGEVGEGMERRICSSGRDCDGRDWRDMEAV